ncbi:MAG TPA: 4Fe-4S binding protein [Gemmatimonadales bacterium]|nr:4Fe-4S binding protein [Gemmatimonadales bacterium]
MRPALERYEQGSAALLVNRAWCKGCKLCLDACPSRILALDQSERVYVTDIGRCIFCGLCSVRCPDFVFALARPSRGSAAVSAGVGIA